MERGAVSYEPASDDRASGAVRDVEDQTPIYLYSTINLYVSAADINELIKQYGEEAAEDETIEEIIPADLCSITGAASATRFWNFMST